LNLVYDPLMIPKAQPLLQLVGRDARKTLQKVPLEFGDPAIAAFHPRPYHRILV
jgi:hypothetical protein